MEIETYRKVFDLKVKAEAFFKKLVKLPEYETFVKEMAHVQGRLDENYSLNLVTRLEVFDVERGEMFRLGEGYTWVQKPGGIEWEYQEEGSSVIQRVEMENMFYYRGRAGGNVYIPIKSDRKERVAPHEGPMA